MRAILLCGQAGSGKDTIASMIENALPGRVRRLALADPLKEFAKAVFLFSDLQLWGPSEARNEIDVRGADLRYWDSCRERLWNVGREFVREWVEACGTSPRGTGHAVLEWFEALTPYPFEPGRGVDASARVKLFSPRHVLQTLGTDYGRRVFGPDVWARIALRRAAREEIAVITDGRFPNEVDAFTTAGAKIVRVVDHTAPEATGAIHGHPSERGLLGINPGKFHAWIVNDKTQGYEPLRVRVLEVLEGFGWIE